MKRLNFLAAGLVALASVSARAQAAPKPLDDAGLADVRAGYVAAGGVTFDFAAQISTYVDSKLVLQSRLSLNDQGLSTEQTGLPAGRDGFVLIPGQGGDTQVRQLLQSGQLGAVTLNTASNRDIRQDTAINLVVPGLADLQGQIGLQKLGGQLNAAGATGTIGRLGR